VTGTGTVHSGEEFTHWVIGERGGIGQKKIQTGENKKGEGGKKGLVSPYRSSGQGK